MPQENIDKCATQIAQGYGACRYLDGVNDGAEWHESIELAEDHAMLAGMKKIKVRAYTLKEAEERIAWLEKQNFNVDNTNKEYLRGYREGTQEILDKYSELEKRCADKPYYTELLGYFHGKRLNHSVEEIIDWLKSKI